MLRPSEEDPGRRRHWPGCAYSATGSAVLVLASSGFGLTLLPAFVSVTGLGTPILRLPFLAGPPLLGLGLLSMAFLGWGILALVGRLVGVPRGRPPLLDLFALHDALDEWIDDRR
jgi:hypothetical protein